MSVAGLRELAEKAPKGPWFNVVNDLIGGRMVATVDKPASEIRLPDDGVVGELMTNEAAAFIAAANPETVLALLDVAEAAKAELALREHMTIGEQALAASLARLEARPAVADGPGGERRQG